MKHREKRETVTEGSKREAIEERTLRTGIDRSCKRSEGCLHDPCMNDCMNESKTVIEGQKDESGKTH